MSSRRLDSLPYTLALGVVGTIYLGGPAPEPPLQPGRGPSCPISVGTQVKAVKAFREMLPVFRHPRCLNCHGGVDPLSPDHRGVDQLDPEIDRMTDREAFEAQCQECHDGLVGWNTPGEPVFFVGKSDEELCKQMKRFESTGEKFVEHIHNDHGGIQFIAAGFAGDRALGEGLSDYGLVAEQPPGTQAQLTAQAQKWVDLLGSGYEASPECGCVLPKVKLEVRHTTASVIPHGLPAREESEAKFEVELEPMGDDKPGMFQGQHSLTREIKLTLPADCTGNGSRGERWVLYAAVDTASGSVKVWRSVFGDEPEGVIDCKHARGRAQTRLSPGTILDMLGYGELDLPADSGSTKTVADGEQGYRESLTITVLEVP